MLEGKGGTEKGVGRGGSNFLSSPSPLERPHIQARGH